MSKTASPYRIVLSVTEADCQLAIATLHSIAGNTLSRAHIAVLGPRTVTDVIQGLSGWQTNVQFVASTANNHDELFAEALRTFGREDVLVIRPGTVVPNAWDARLAAAARRRDNIATVSPLCSRYLAVDMPQKLSADPEECARWVDLVDRNCYEFSAFEQPPVPSFFEACVYVRAEAIHASSPAKPADFGAATTRLRYEHIIADHVFVGSLPSVFAGEEEPKRSSNPLFSRLQAHATTNLDGGAVSGPHAGRAGRSRKLHVLHSWGGGLEHWVREYCWADTQHENLVLKSAGAPGEFGTDLRLYRTVDDEQPLAAWNLSPSIPGTAVTHGAYRAALYQIIEEYAIDSLVISSLVGHSLEVLQTDLPTVFVCHDFYPFCPALNITYNGICTSCKKDELTDCTLNNPLNRFFPNLPPAAWRRLRLAFIKICRQRPLWLVAPSESVRNHYAQLVPSFKDKFTVIPHGTRPLTAEPLALDLLHEGKLRVLVLGSLAPQKGLALFQAIAHNLVQSADIYLIGCGSYGSSFHGIGGITVIPEYVREQLPALLDVIRPDLALLMSVVPETFSYTLQELLELAIPVLATDVGSFSDRIQDKRNGFLCARSPEALQECIGELNSNRRQLVAVHQHLRATRPATVQKMVLDYEALLQTPDWSPAAYFQQDRNYFSPRDRVQLFWRPAKGGFTEQESHSTFYRPGKKPDLLHLPVPPLSYVPGQLRLDFGDRPGLRLLKSIRLLDLSGAPLWILRPSEAHFETQNDAQWVSTLPDGSLVMVATGEDPFVSLPVDGQALLALQRGGALEIEIAAPPPEEYLTVMLRRQDYVPKAEVLRLIHDHEAKLREFDQRIQHHADEAAARDRLIRILCHALADGQMRSRMERQRLENQVAQIQADLRTQEVSAGAVQAGLLQQLAQVYDSYSWWVSKPLRVVGSLLLRLRPSLLRQSSNGRKPPQ